MIGRTYWKPGLRQNTRVTASDPTMPRTTLSPVTQMTEDTFDAAWQHVGDIFGDDAYPSDRDVERATIDLSRFLVVQDGDEVVATSGAFNLDMAVPGGQLPVAGVSWVGVAGTHRRQGLLRTMMERLLSDAYERGEAVAALHATQAAIYHRFGFGPAGWGFGITVPQHAAFTVAVPPGGVRRVAPEAGRLSAVYDEVQAVTPGMTARDAAWWAYRLHDPDHKREGESQLRCAVTDGGYVLFTVRRDGTALGLSEGTVRVRELLATSREAHARLWRYALDVDLMTQTTARIAIDDPLLQMLAEPRDAQGRYGDVLWARTVELGAALSGRTYATPVDVVLEIADRTCPWNEGRWRLSGDRTGATCTKTTDPADLATDVAELGAAYLGGTPLHARAVTELTPGALAVASTAFGPIGTGPFSPLVW